MNCVAVLVVLLSATLYLLYSTTTSLATGNVEFLPFYPPPVPELVGVLAVNDKLTRVKHTAEGMECILCVISYSQRGRQSSVVGCANTSTTGLIEGPESVCIDSKGNWFVTTADGYIYKLTPAGEVQQHNFTHKQKAQHHT